MRAVWLVVYKDLLIEWRARSRIVALICFALTAVLLFTFAVGPKTNVLRIHAPGYLWLALLFTSTALLSRSLRVEEESGAMDSLLLVPVSPISLFYGKAIANTVQLVLLGLITLPVVLVLCAVEAVQAPGLLLLCILLGAMALAAPGTLYAALTARVSGQQMLMPLLLFPLVVPALLAAVNSTSLALENVMEQDESIPLLVLFLFDAIYWALCGVLFGKVVES